MNAKNSPVLTSRGVLLIGGFNRLPEGKTDSSIQRPVLIRRGIVDIKRFFRRVSSYYASCVKLLLKE
jgi:hypothetical protein